IGPFGLKAILAEVYVDKSLIDKKDCIVLDYSKTSLVAKHIRDEIRQIAPNTYLGPVYWDTKKLFYFALQFKARAGMGPWRWRFEVLVALVVGVPLFAGLMLAQRFLPDRPVTYAAIEDHFKYGSTGGERNAGFPLFIWKALPVVFKDKLPQNGAE